MSGLRFSVVDAALWTAEEAHQQLLGVLPQGWSCVVDYDDLEAVVLIRDESDAPLQVARNADPKLAILDVLGWLSLRQHKTTHAAWAPRSQEVHLHRPNKDTVSVEVPDLDPSEIAAVYNATRRQK